MILVCAECKASYLVPATVFVAGPRNVRCARCKHTWLADVPPQITVMPVTRETSFSETQSSAGSQASAESALVPEAATEAAASPEEANVAEPPITEPPVDVPPVDPSKLPTVWQHPRWKWIKAGAVVAAIILVIAGLLNTFVDRKAVDDLSRDVRYFVLDALGKIPHLPGEGLSLDQVRSERRFESGSMKLVVEGEIRNHNAKLAAIPPLRIQAYAADGAVMEEWLADPPAPLLKPNEFVPFQSIVAIQGTVVEITVSFAELPHAPEEP